MIAHSEKTAPLESSGGRLVGRRGRCRLLREQEWWSAVLADLTPARSTLGRVVSRPVIDLDSTLDGGEVESETTCTWAGAWVLTVHTVIPRADLALELHSTFVGHHNVRTHAVHLALGPPGRAAELTSSDHDRLDPMLAPRGCVYEHAQRLIETLDVLGHRAAVDVSGDRAFEQLERGAVSAA